MTSKDRNLFALKGFLLTGLIFFSALNATSLAAEDDESVIYQGEKYDISYFFAISGEVYGQAAPGVEAVLVNGNPVKVEKDLTFKAQVFLKEGEKYLNIETQYQGLRFIKRYLVIRHPKVQKTFRIHVPEKEFKEIVKKAETIKKPAPAKKKEEPKKEVIKKIVSEGYEFVAQLEKEKFLAVKRVDGKYFGSIYDLKSKIWFPLQEISLQEMKDLLETGAIPPSFDP